MASVLRRLMTAIFVFLAACGSEPNETELAASRSELANAQIDFLGLFPEVVSVESLGRCSGTLIESNYVLTAAHCVCRIIPREVGFFQDASKCEPRAVVQFRRLAFDRALRIPGDVVVHPSFHLEMDPTKFNASGRADLALIKLAQPAPDWARFLPATLSDEKPASGERLTLVGYGSRTCSGEFASFFRRWGTATTGTEPFGNEQFPDVFYTERQDTDDSGAVAVHGDSGGPAFQEGGITRRILGVFTSFTCTQRAGRFRSTVSGRDNYTRLDFFDDVKTKKTYRDWIVQQVVGAPEETCNLVDDNDDGQIDEDHDWTVGPWTTVASGGC